MGGLPDSIALLAEAQEKGKEAMTAVPLAAALIENVSDPLSQMVNRLTLVRGSLRITSLDRAINYGDDALNDLGQILEQLEEIKDKVLAAVNVTETYKRNLKT